LRSTSKGPKRIGDSSDIGAVGNASPHLYFLQRIARG